MLQIGDAVRFVYAAKQPRRIFGVVSAIRPCTNGARIITVTSDSGRKYVRVERDVEKLDDLFRRTA